MGLFCWSLFVSVGLFCESHLRVSNVRSELTAPGPSTITKQVSFVGLFCGSLLWVSFMGLFCGSLLRVSFVGVFWVSTESPDTYLVLVSFVGLFRGSLFMSIGLFL